MRDHLQQTGHLEGRGYSGHRLLGHSAGNHGTWEGTLTGVVPFRSAARGSLLRQACSSVKPATLVLVCILFVFSCVGCRTLDGKMQRQVGQPRDKLIEEFGPPQRELRLMDGTTALWFQRGPSGKFSFTAGGGYPAGTCREVFYLNRKGIVTSASVHDCVGVCLGRYCW